MKCSSCWERHGGLDLGDAAFFGGGAATVPFAGGGGVIGAIPGGGGHWSSSGSGAGAFAGDFAEPLRWWLCRLCWLLCQWLCRLCRSPCWRLPLWHRLTLWRLAPSSLRLPPRTPFFIIRHLQVYRAFLPLPPCTSFFSFSFIFLFIISFGLAFALLAFVFALSSFFSLSFVTGLSFFLFSCSFFSFSRLFWLSFLYTPVGSLDNSHWRFFRKRKGRSAGLCPGGARLNANMQLIKTGTTYHLRR